jgi:hypothetical protein
MWTHGNNALIEFQLIGRDGQDILVAGGTAIPWTAPNGLRRGWGVTYRCQPHSDYWFHFTIPTPVIKDGVRARLRRAFVLFGADPGATLSEIAVYDGKDVVIDLRGLAVGGDHSGLPLENDINAFNLPDREVLFGVGISVKFSFTDAGSVTLNSAGVDFEI